MDAKARKYHGRVVQPKLGPCAPHEILTRLGDKWTILTLSVLSRAPGNLLRFTDIKAAIDRISQRMMTVTLRNLERDGLVVRHYFPEVPPRVEYELSELGKDLLPALDGFTAWIRSNWPAIETARRSYDQRSGAKTTAS